MLFIMPYSHVDSFIFECRRNRAKVSHAIVIRKKHFRTNDFGGSDKLLRRHRIRLIARQESDIHVLNCFHFGNILSVTCNINPKHIDGKQAAVEDEV